VANRVDLLNEVPAPRPEPAAEQAPLAWWHLRSWRVDRDVLARVRDGLHALAPRSGPAAAPLTETEKPQTGTEPTPAGPAVSAAPEPAASGSAAATSEPEAEAVAPSPLTEPAVAAIRSTFAIVAEAGDAVPGYFYGQLFARQPRLRALFPPAMDAQRDRLVKALVQIVESLTTPEEMAAYLAQLGRDHRKYGVDPGMYAAVGAALLATLRRFAGTAFTPAAEQAWTDAYAAVSALMIEGADEAAATAPAYWSAEVVGVEERFPGMAVLTIALDQGMRFEAGQHITVQHPRWPRVWRSYSIAGCPREDGLVQLHVKAIPGGWVSNALVRHTEPGSELIVGPPLGTMTLAPAGDRDLVCVAGGTGLAPIKAIVAQAVRDSVRDAARAPAARARRVHLFCGARRRAELYDLTDLWHLADAWPGLEIVPVTSDDRAFEGMQGNVGRVAARYLPHRRCEAYVAGPPAMVRETIRVLAQSGVPRERIHFDDALLAGPGSPLPERG
jgi:NAD(P)H-flavin reductase/hemoglobin-like flavoprotein